MNAQVNTEHIVLTKKEESKADFEREVIDGLLTNRKSLPFKYNYDLNGSKILEDLQQTKQYYLWSSDRDILQNKGGDILKLIGQKKFNLIDLGAGDATKTKILIRQAIENGHDITYIPVDISYHSNLDLIKACNQQFPTLKMRVLTGEYEEGIQWIKNNTSDKNVFIIPGNSFGNNSKQSNLQFMKLVYSSMKIHDQMYLGLDLWKDPEVITRAYLDNGLQQAFMLNILARINTELNGNFKIENYFAFPYFDPYERVKRNVIMPKVDQQVQIGQHKFFLKQSEPIQCSFSRKWLISDMETLADSAGLTLKTYIDDDRKYFRYFVIEKSS